jgi:predicted DNA-binding transcriptional regulator YafY
MSKKEYDKTLFRLIGILTKLANGEHPTVKELSCDYNVSTRTIQKDLNERLGYIYPIERDSQNRYRFAYGFNLKQTTLSEDEMVFLQLALSQFEDVEDINKIRDTIYKKIIQKKFYSPYFIKQDDLEDLDIDSPFISQLESIIKNKERVRVTFSNTTKDLDIYKIAAFDGFWYIFAKDVATQKIQTYQLSHIQKITPTGKYHTTSEDYIKSVLERVHSAFFEDGNSFEVVVRVFPEIAIYFKNKEFLQSQVVEEEKEDGSLIVRFEVSHDEDIDNIIKSWLPHIEVLKPQRYREKLLDELKEYIKRVQTN